MNICKINGDFLEVLNFKRFLVQLLFPWVLMCNLAHGQSLACRFRISLDCRERILSQQVHFISRSEFLLFIA